MNKRMIVIQSIGIKTMKKIMGDGDRLERRKNNLKHKCNILI